MARLRMLDMGEEEKLPVTVLELLNKYVLFTLFDCCENAEKCVGLGRNVVIRILQLHNTQITLGQSRNC